MIMENAKNETKFQFKMNKKNIVVLIASAILLITTTVILVSCDWFNTEAPIDVQVQNALQEVLTAAMSGDEEPEGLLVESESRSGFKVLSCTETDTGVIVTFLVHAPDLYTVAKDIDENYTFETEEELQNAVIDAISKAEIIEQEVTIEFIKTGDGYEPILTTEFIDAYYGGVLRMLNEALNNMGEEAEQ